MRSGIYLFNGILTPYELFNAGILLIIQALIVNITAYIFNVPLQSFFNRPFLLKKLLFVGKQSYDFKYSYKILITYTQLYRFNYYYLMISLYIVK